MRRISVLWSLPPPSSLHEDQDLSERFMGRASEGERFTGFVLTKSESGLLAFQSMLGVKLAMRVAI